MRVPAFDPSRRSFFRGSMTRTVLALRPPWARVEEAFVEFCTRCDDCVRACPDQVLIRGAGGYPEVDFKRAACTLCGDCAAACKAGALCAPDLDEVPAWRHRARIGDNCLSVKGIVCRACGDACEADAIRFRPMTGGRSQPLVDTQACTGCGGCLFVCPTDAVSFPVPEEHEALCPA
jgi:ferredoxin-type protein NapF